MSLDTARSHHACRRLPSLIDAVRGSERRTNRPVLPRIKGDKRLALRTVNELMLKAHECSFLTDFVLESDLVDDHLDTASLATKWSLEVG